MRRVVLIVPLLAVLTSPVAAETPAAGWTTYRSDQFGYEFSYPPEVQLKVYFEGSSAEIRDAGTGHPLAELEVWPPGECPRQPKGVSARALGIEHVTSVTQADGADGSSWCGEPLTVREHTSPNGIAIYELELTCKSERLEVSEDGSAVGKPIVTTEGKKGPTYFADISPSWRTQILCADPVGVDPRMSPPRHGADPAVTRKILDTLKTFPIEKPDTVCIEDLEPRGFTAARPHPGGPAPSRGTPAEAR